MTFSICVREPHEGEDGEGQTRYGVAVTTRLPAVGTLCPFVNEHGAVGPQSFVHGPLGRRGGAGLAGGPGRAAGPSPTAPPPARPP